MPPNDQLPDRRRLPRSAAASTRQRRSFADRVADRPGFRRVDPRRDIRRTPEGFEIRDRVKRLAAARRLEGEVTLDELDPNRDLEETANGFRLSERGRRRAAAQRLESETVVSDLDPQQDLVQQEDGYQLAAQRRKEIAADRISDQSQLFDELSASEIALTEDGAEVKPDALKAAGAEELESQSEYLQNLSPDDVQVSEDGIAPTQDVVEQAEQRAQRDATRQAAADVLAQRIEGYGFAEPSDVTKQNGEFVLSQSARADLQSAVDSGVIDQSEISNIDASVSADSLGGGSAAVAEQRREFANALESGEAFESGEPPEGLGSVDPQEDIAVEDGQLTLADETQAELIESQIRSQVGDRPGLNTENVLQRAASQDEIIEAVEEQIETQSGTDVRPGLIEDANLSVSPDGTITADRVLLNSRRFDDFFDVGPPGDRTDVLEGANLSVDATEQFQEQIEQSIAEQISERNVVDVSRDQIDISGGSVDVQAEDSLTVDPEEITADGLQSDAQQDLARRQLQRVQTTEGVSVDTPVNNQAFANVSAALAQAADGGGSLSSATRIVAASDTVDNVGDLDDLPDSRIIAGLDPEMAADRFGGIDAQQVRDAQQAIQQRRQQLDNDPQSVLEDIASNEDEFINDATRIGVAGERGQRIRQAARSRINELEADIAASDSDVSAGDVGVTLTDDLSGIRSINDAGRQAIAEQVDSQLANFDSSEIEVSVADGQIQTSIEDSVRARFAENAERVEEIQARNRIADADPSIDRREIAVDAESGSVALTQEGLNQARLDAVDAETGPGEIVPDLNTQTQGADLDVRDIRLQRGEDGELQVGLSEMTRTRLRTERPSLSELEDDAVSVTRLQNEYRDPIKATEAQFRAFGRDIQPEVTSAAQAVTGLVTTGSIVPTVEEALTGTNVSERFSNSAGEGAARYVNPGFLAADATRAIDLAARGPNRDLGFEDLLGGQEAEAISAGAQADSLAELETAERSLSVTPEQFITQTAEQNAANLAQRFESDPVATAGQLTGGLIAGALVGTAATRGALRVGRADISDLDAGSVRRSIQRAGDRVRPTPTGRVRGGSRSSPVGSRTQSGIELEDIESINDRVDNALQQADESLGSDIDTTANPTIDRSARSVSDSVDDTDVEGIRVDDPGSVADEIDGINDVRSTRPDPTPSRRSPVDDPLNRPDVETREVETDTDVEGIQLEDRGNLPDEIQNTIDDVQSTRPDPRASRRSPFDDPIAQRSSPEADPDRMLGGSPFDRVDRFADLTRSNYFGEDRGQVSLVPRRRRETPDLGEPLSGTGGLPPGALLGSGLGLTGIAVGQATGSTNQQSTPTEQLITPSASTTIEDVGTVDSDIQEERDDGIGFAAGGEASDIQSERDGDGIGFVADFGFGVESGTTTDDVATPTDDIDISTDIGQPVRNDNDSSILNDIGILTDTETNIDRAVRPRAGTEIGLTGGSPGRRTPDPDVPDGESDGDDPAEAVDLQFDDELFDSGIASGDEVLDDLLGGL